MADIAAVDCVSFAGREKYSPELTRGRRVIGYSDPYPALPLITSIETSATTFAALCAAMTHAMRDPDLDATRKALFIEGFEPIDVSAYQVCAQMRDRAIALGCHFL